MQRRSFRPIVWLTFGLSVLPLAMTVPVYAEDKKVEKEARDLQKKAIEEDSLATDYDSAQKKLNQALSKCGENKCSTALKAELRRDLGAMLVFAKKKDDGLSAFVEALKLDGTLSLNPAYKTPEIEALWEQAKKKVGGGAAPVASPTPAATPAPAASGGEISGDFTHTPVAEQLVRTAVPIYVEYSGSESLVKVIARYKGSGMTEFRTLELKRMGKGYGAYTDCKDVFEGTISYYLQGFNDQNDPVATSGNRGQTFKVPIRKKVQGDPASLPGQSAPKQCKDASDCPEGAAGAECRREAGVAEPTPKPEEDAGAPHEDTTKKGEGEDCDEDYECRSNQCKAGRCLAPAEDKPKDSPRRIWIGAAFGLDFGIIPSSTDVCLRSADGTTAGNDAGYVCTDPNGADYPASREENDNIVRGQNANRVRDGGIAMGNVRLMLAGDYAVSGNLLAGLRLGFLTGAYPGSKAIGEGKGLGAPIHAEVRGTYLIGDAPLFKNKPAPYVFVGGGISQFSTGIGVEVDVKDSSGTTTRKKATAWYVGGPGFFTVGGGYRYPFGRVALLGGIKFTGAFGGIGFSPIFSPELGMQVGF